VENRENEEASGGDFQIIDRRKTAGQQSEQEGDGRQEQGIVIPDILPLLPLIETVAFPHVIVPLSIGRESSIKLVDDAVIKGEKVLGLALSRNPEQEQPDIANVHPIGVAAVIHTMMRLPDGQRMIVQGLKRIRILEAVQTSPYLRVRVEKLSDEIDYQPEEELEIEALKRNLARMFSRLVNASDNLPDELQAITRIPQPGVLADTMAAHLPIPPLERQEILETLGLRARMRLILKILTRELEVVEIGNKIASDVHSELGKSQREYYLREQLKAIQKELGQEGDRDEIEELRQAIEAAGMPEEARTQAERELERLTRMSAGHPEYGVTRNYLDWLVKLPWNRATEDNLDIPTVRRILDEDHYGLEKVKERILEYLSVRKFKSEGTVRQPILCLVGPPGVGKTSLGMSIARALGKKFVRISLGGMHDEAEIRGHRRTYIGALPGQIIQGIRRADTNNPVFMLDEIDKVGRDFRGDPSSALLEVLDPEQNSTFRDHFLEVTFDLSKVLFITTANILETIPPPLRDRMEVIEIPGYTEEEKVEIAHRHLVPKQMEEHGLKKTHVRWRRSALRHIIRGYTREAGVRNLERQIAAICRKATRQFAEGRQEPVVVTGDVVQEFLGAPRFLEQEVVERTTTPGVGIGLAWTPVGGDVLFVEAARMPGSGQLILTGQLGDVMQESARAALSWVRSRAEVLGIDKDLFRSTDIHLHVPAGGVPKDGPSAGAVITATLVSLLTGRRMKPRLAMTGEVTLRGKVLPVGGIKEKVLAARRAGVRTVLLPEANRKDVEEDVPENVRNGLEIVYVRDMDQVLELALEPPRAPGRARRQSGQKMAAPAPA
jgi:ATP-dependent Lon protease